MIPHAELGASSMARWATCPGSVVLSRGEPNIESVHARLGSAAHALGEHCLLTGDLVMEYLDETHPVEEFADVPVDIDMVEAVSVYVDYARDTLPVIDADNVERRVSLAALGEWAEGMFGTADLCALVGNTLHVGDYKHGQGVQVDVEDNHQFKYYGLGAFLSLTQQQRNDLDVVATTVIQPRKPHEDGPVRSYTYKPGDLLRWGQVEVKRAVERVERATDLHESMDGQEWADEFLHPSEKACKFCRAKAKCPKRRSTAMDAALLEFGDDGVARPVKPLEKLTDEEVAQILENEKQVTDWLAGVREYAHYQLDQGHDSTAGRFKLVAGRSNRSWKNEDVAATKLYAMGLEQEDIYTRKLKSPAQAEKLVGKKRAKDLEDLVAKDEGKPVMVPASDKRPALGRGPDADFLD